MKRKNLLINLCLIFSLLFCMAFGCNDGGEKDGATTDDGASTRRAAQEEEDDDDESSPMTTQMGIGAKYGARDPRRCAKMKATGEKPSIAEAVASVICNGEGVSGEQLYLYEDVKITSFGKGQRPNPKNYYTPAADMDSLEYEIRGSAEWYSCSEPGSLSQPEKGCTLYDEANAEGSCYKDTFGSWFCSMHDKSLNLGRDFTKVVPPR